MATRRVKLSGIAYWAKVFPENRDLTGFENALADVGGQTTIDIDLDKVGPGITRGKFLQVKCRRHAQRKRKEQGDHESEKRSHQGAPYTRQFRFP